MSVTVKFGSRVVSKTRDETGESLAYQGTKSEIDAQLAAFAPGTWIDSSAHPEFTISGRVSSCDVKKVSPERWELTVEISKKTATSSSDEPYETVGEKSCELNATMLLLPLTSHPDYKTCWEYHLAAAPGVTQYPTWWATAVDTNITGASDQAKYAWVKSLSEAPNSGGVSRWHIVRKRLEPADQYSFPTYTVTEKAKYRSATAAGNALSKVLGKRGGTPSETFGVSDDREWMCENARIYWSGKAWYAELTWTLSGDSNGWSSRLYKHV